MTAQAPTSDGELLGEYVAGSHDAFAELVTRYVGAVYSAACRQVGDRHLAEDVTQAVFLLLSQKAKTLRTGTILAAWLHRATRYCAANALRVRANRRRHERMAAEMMTHRDAGREELSDWPAISAALDEAINRLPVLERQAIVLHFLQGKTHADVAVDLGMSPDAAAKKTQRGLMKLRDRLARSGHGTTVSSLGAALASKASEAVPPQLVKSISSGVASPASLSPHLASIANGALRMMFWIQFKFVAAIVGFIVLLVAGAATAVVVTSQMISSPSQMAGGAGVNAPQAQGVSRPAASSQPDIDPAWRKEFDGVYTLDPNEPLRRIRPPFIEARKGFLLDEYSVNNATTINGIIGNPDAGYTTAPPGALFLEYDDRTHRVERWVRSSQRAWALESLTNNLIGLSPDQYILPAEIGNVRIAGDWVIRRGAAIEAKMQSFQNAVRDTRAAFDVEKKSIHRQVIIARGTFVKEEWTGGVVSVSLAGDKGHPRSAGDVKFYFRQLTKMLGRPVINEWNGSEDAHMEFGDNTIVPGLKGADGAEKLKDALSELGRQMHIEMTEETRTIDTWVFSPAQDK